MEPTIPKAAGRKHREMILSPGTPIFSISAEALKIESSTSGISQKTSIPAPIKTSAITHPYLVAEFKRCFFLAPKLYPIMGIKP